MHSRVLILSSRVGTGHIAAAAALERAFRSRAGVEVCRLDAIELATPLLDLTYSGLYFPMARVAPWLMEWGYEATNRPFADGGLLALWDRLNATALVRRMCAFQPDHVVCTHFLPAGLAGHLIATGRLQSTLSVVCTDYDLHGQWLVGTFSRFFVALDEAAAHWRALGLPPERVHVAGIPVRPPPAGPPGAGALAELGLRDDLPTVLLSAGAAGRTSVPSVMEKLLHLRRELQAVVVCGRSEATRQAAEALAAARPERFRVLGYTDRMPELMRAATLFVGKPGGLTAAECMAAGLPMLLVEPLPGQETRNADHLLEAGAALRCHELTTVAAKVERVLGDAALLEALRAGARRFGRPGAAAEIAGMVLDAPLEPVQIGRRERRAIALRAVGRLAPAAVG